MTRRGLLKNVIVCAAGALGLTVSGGCMAPRVSPKVADESNGAPWRCEFCGHLTRSDTDLSDTRCPRCRRKRLRRISEEEAQKLLAE
jgi:DNA-directed RNA polymerase subunit RPC12/RpoP